ncbi:MAG: ATP-dependent DNA ligase [Candidatus Dojkabacteria bacterium]
MRFQEFIEYLEKLEELSSRNEMVEVLVQLLQKLENSEANEAMYMLQGRIAPLFIDLEFNISTKLLLKALDDLSEEPVEEVYKKVGDIGLAAEEVCGEKSSGLSIEEVRDHLEEIAIIKGKDSQTKKKDLIVALSKKVSGKELKFISRIIVGKLRLGLSDKTVLDAMSWMLTGDKSLRSRIEHAFGVSADLGKIAEVLKTEGIDGLEKMSVTPGVPVAVKLVEREKDTKAIFERMGEAVVQPKYDGLRFQVHFSKAGFDDEIESSGDLKHVRIFSRKMENLTFMFPDVIDAIQRFQVESIVLDAEAIVYDPKSDQLLTFQETMQRKRKTNIEEMAKMFPIKVFCFDIMYLNGTSLLKAEQNERLETLRKVMEANDNKTLVLSESQIVKSAKEMEDVFQKYVSDGLEGIIVKGLDTHYDPGTRNYDWIKLKAASQSHMADTVDAVVMGYYLGTGARTKFGIGAFLIGTYDRATDKYISLAKVGTGITDKEFVQIKRRLDQIAVDNIPKNYEIDRRVMPDVLVRPEVVVVVEADEVSKSQVHGVVGREGYSLRFPRLIQFDRQDKRPEDTTSPGELKRLATL